MCDVCALAGLRGFFKRFPPRQQSLRYPGKCARDLRLKQNFLAWFFLARSEKGEATREARGAQQEFSNCNCLYPELDGRCTFTIFLIITLCFVSRCDPRLLRVAGASEGCRFAAAGPNNVRQALLEEQVARAKR